MILIISQPKDVKAFEFLGPTSHGAPIDRDAAQRMMDLYWKRLARIGTGNLTPLNLNEEKTQAFFRRANLTQLSTWEYLGVGFAVSVQDVDTSGNPIRRPPTQQEMTRWENDPNDRLPLVSTVILAETDRDGKFLFRTGAQYEVYDFAGICCPPGMIKSECIKKSFVMV